jgi:prepilin-type N-terminal cleavage/methylation domain-containing protein
MARSSKSLGFTLIEVMIVVAIIGTLASLAVWNLTQRRQTSTVEAQASDLQAAILRAQSLAAVAGSRIGDPARLISDPATCPGVPGGGIWVVIAPPNYIAPAQVAYNAAVDVMTVFCSVNNFSVLTNNVGVISAVTTSPFGFTSAGRLTVPFGAPPPSVFIQTQVAAQPTSRFGFRILASGVICTSANNNLAAPCDEALF